MPILSFGDTLDSVPEGLREHAKETDGKFKVNVVHAGAIDEFRANNIKVTKALDEATARLGPLQEIVGDDVDGFRHNFDELRAIKGRVDAGELKTSTALDEAVQRNTETMRKGYEEQIGSKNKENAALKTRAEDYDRRWRQERVTNAIKDVALTSADLGVDPTAIDDITARALRTFRCDDTGKITPYGEGDAPMIGNSGVDPMTPYEWLKKLREERPYLFKSSNGGGAGGGAGHGDRKIHVEGRFSTAELAAMKPHQRLDALNNVKKPTRI